MKILRLDLIAFGPFTETSLAFHDNTPGFHLVYGRNEAGKSSALRALRQMLFGIPTRTPDDFIHPYGRMRIGGLLQDRQGRRLEIIRRKGRRHTLRGPDDTAVVDEARLRSLLGGVDEPLFSAMFGIDHAGLVAGGQAILQGAGDAGQVLFAAGAGIADFRKVLLDLRAEADALFKPAAQKPAINLALAELQNIRKAQLDAQLPGQAWVDHDHALREAARNKAGVEQELERQTRERNRLSRIRDALPAIARRAALLEQYQGLRSAALLPEDFGERRLSAIESLRIAESREARAKQRIASILEERDGLSDPVGLIENKDAISAMFQEAGSIQKAAADRLRLEGLLSSTRREARERLKALGRDIPLDQAETLRVERPAAIRIQELASRHERLEALSEGVGEALAKLAPRVERLEADLEALPPPVSLDGLKQALAEATALGDLDARQQSLQTEIQGMEADLDIAMSRLTLWTGSAEALERLPLPPPETIDAFDVRLGAAADRLLRLREEASALLARLGEIDADLRKLALSGDIPTEADLADARIRRDQTWGEIRKAWDPGGDAAAAETDTAFDHMADTYDSHVREADDLSDRLRREAGRVAAKAALLAEQERVLTRKTQVETAISHAEERSVQAHAEWTGLWRAAGISPRSPREMRAWLLRQTDLAARITAIRDHGAKRKGMVRQIEQCRRALAGQLPADPPGETPRPLSRLIQQAREAVSRHEAVEAQRKRMSQELAERGEDLREARRRAAHIDQQRRHWRSAWQEAVRPLGLAPEATPAEAAGILTELNALFDKLREADVLAERIRGIDRDREAFTSRVQDFVSMQASELAGADPIHAVRELNTELARALAVRTTREALDKQLAQERDALAEATDQIHRIKARIEALCQEAGCGGEGELGTAEARSDARRRIEAELERTEAQLRSLAAGQPLPAFIDEASSVDADTLELRITRRDEALSRLGREKSDLDQAIGSHGAALAGMDGGHQAADLAEQGQERIAGIRSDVERYLRLRMAAAFLNRAMERYRKKNQGPIVRRAAALFSRMTLGSFEGLRVDFDDSGNAVLVGVRPGGKEVVHVSGMSDGTADQLYLAIRLASLEAYLQGGEPLPFIVDDILIQFDDRRAEATLDALLELAEKTQVIFFTHHRHLVDLARSRLKDAADVHTLASRAAMEGQG